MSEFLRHQTTSQLQETSPEPTVEAPRPTQPRRLSRECVAQGLYQWLMTGEAGSVIRTQLQDRIRLTAIKLDQGFFLELWEGVMTHANALQTLLEQWIDRPWHEISYVERAVLLLGAYELVHCPNIPLKVAINEALEINKTFGGSEGHRYVNSILDRCATQYRTENK